MFGGAPYAPAERSRHPGAEQVEDVRGQPQLVQRQSPVVDVALPGPLRDGGVATDVDDVAVLPGPDPGDDALVEELAAGVRAGVARVEWQWIARPPRQPTHRRRSNRRFGEKRRNPCLERTKTKQRGKRGEEEEEGRWSPRSPCSAFGGTVSALREDNDGANPDVDRRRRGVKRELVVVHLLSGLVAVVPADGVREAWPRGWCVASGCKHRSAQSQHSHSTVTVTAQHSQSPAINRHTVASGWKHRSASDGHVGTKQSM